MVSPTSTACAAAAVQLTDMTGDSASAVRLQGTTEREALKRDANLWRALSGVRGIAGRGHSGAHDGLHSRHDGRHGPAQVARLLMHARQQERRHEVPCPRHATHHMFFTAAPRRGISRRRRTCRDASRPP